VPNPRTNTIAQRMSFIAPICARVCTQLLQPLVQSLIGIPVPTRPPPKGSLETTRLLTFGAILFDVLEMGEILCSETRGSRF